MHKNCAEPLSPADGIHRVPQQNNIYVSVKGRHKAAQRYNPEPFFPVPEIDSQKISYVGKYLFHFCNILFLTIQTFNCQLRKTACLKSSFKETFLQTCFRKEVFLRAASERFSS